MKLDDYINEPLPFEKEALRYFDRSQSLIIFDIGSCEGEDSIKLGKLFPKANIYSFEPVPSNLQKIKNNFKKYGHSPDNLFGIALSNKNGNAEFYVSSGQPPNLPKLKDWDYGNKSSSLLPPKEHKKIHKWVKFNQKIKIKTQRLDSFCKEQELKEIDLIFLDVQGAELMVLEGAGDLLKKVGMIWLEVEAVELYDGQPLKNDVEIFMSKHGFKCIKDTVDNVSGDQFYINRRLTDKSFLSKLNFLRS